MIMNLSAPCHFGLESVLKYELKKINAENISAHDGRVDFTGDFETVAKANVNCSVAERIRICLGEFYAKSFSEFIEECDQIRWEDFIGRNDKFPVKGSALDCEITSIPRLQATVKKSAVNRLKSVYNVNFCEETDALFQIEFSGLKNTYRIYIDTTGAGLHKRGYRPSANTAPIKETLAAGIADIARVKYENSVTDPFCGSGTLLIESVYKALNIAPGLRRKFTAESWTHLNSPEIWDSVRSDAKAKINKDKDFTAYGYDIDPEAVELTIKNAERAGIRKRIIVKCADIRKGEFPQNGIILTNPPYGERMLDLKEAEELYRVMGQKFSPPAAVISPHEDFEKFYGVRASKKRKLYNGMIKCNLYLYNN
ncbi:MAG: class I SAM-dependent RNA methyltransferase [Ruminococcus sp.]|nr:class I SAM-dependent RNA methyltransferase [Ruminococcus sp.]